MDDEALIIGLYFYALEREREREGGALSSVHCARF